MPGNKPKTKPDPRQALFLSFYLDPKSETFSNGRGSAIRAGYDEDYADQLIAIMPDWLKDSVKYDKLLNQAEKNLDTYVTSCEDDKLKLDATKFVAGRLGKGRWSERQEHTGKDGERVIVNIIDYKKDTTKDPSGSSDVSLSNNPPKSSS